MKTILITMITAIAICAFSVMPAFAFGNANADASVGSVQANITQNYGDSVEKNFVNQGGVPVYGMPAYLAQPKNGYAEMTPANVLRFAKNFDVSEYDKEYGVKVIIDTMNPVAEGEVLPTKVTFIGTGIEADDPDFPAERREMAIITIIATRTDVTMTKVIKTAAAACASVDADVAFIEAFGSDRKVNAHGWGIGLSYTAADVAGNGNAGRVATGGTGYSQGQASYHGYPWIQIHALSTVPSETAE